MATANFQFTTLAGTEQAGHTSINALMTSIDGVLTTRMPSVATTSGSNQYKALIGNSSGYYVAGLIGNDNIDGSAAIAYFKLNLTNSIVSADIVDGTIVNADINASAAIAYSKLNLTGSIVNADVNASAAIAYSKLNLASSVTGSDIVSSVALAGNPTTTTQTAGDNTTKIATTAFVATAVSNGLTGGGNITYSSFSNSAKTYSIVSVSGTTTLTIGTHDSTTSSANPLVNATAASTISIPTGGVVGSTISIFSSTSGTVTVQPVSTSVTINGSTTASYTVAAQYSIVTLICYASNTWLITGDYI